MQAQEINGRDSYAFRPDLQESLSHSHIEPSKLSTFQRILLTTDGTVTEILEAYLFEKIHVVKISEHIVEATADIAALDLKVGDRVIDRKILLQGKISRNNWIYAESLIVPDRLDEIYRERLLKTQEPIGRLWLEHRVENFKEIVDTAREAAGELAGYFKMKKEDRLLSRTYRVFSSRKPVMMITEKFPENYFLNKI